MTRTMIALAGAAVLMASMPSRAQVSAPPPAGAPQSLRITMDTLHQLGGVPAGWMLTPPSGDVGRGRTLFSEFGCQACHVVRGESLPPPTGPGPDLTGMGSHHPAGYFVESILNPNAVIVDGPGFVDANGRSTMPSYPEMTLAQLADLVAYLQSLNAGGMQHLIQPSGTASSDTEVPPPPASRASRYLVQVYDVKPGKLGEFQDWFQREGRAQFMSHPGVLAVDTYADLAHAGPRLMTILTFLDEESFSSFATSPSGELLGQRFDDFIGPHGHDVLRSAPLYRIETLSTFP